MNLTRARAACILLLSLVLAGCVHSPEHAPDTDDLPPDVTATLERFRDSSPKAEAFLSRACGYAVFPRVVRFVMGFGGGTGTGFLVEGSRVTGRVSVAEFIHGISFGGEFYSEIIAFRDAATLEAFKEGNLEFRSRAASSVGPAGLSADPAFNNGVAVFTMTRAGLMLDLSIGAAKFRFTPRPGLEPGPPCGTGQLSD